MSEDTAFSEAHTEPESLPEDTEYIGELKLIKVPDGEDARIYEIKSAYKTNRYLFVFHEWWGLNDHIKSESDRWFKNLRDVNVIAIDLYDGKWTKDREKAAELMQSNDSERSLEIIRAAIDYVGKNATIGTIGWCFGGGWSLQAAIEAGDKAAACVVYYGMPEEDTARLSKLEADVLGLFASQDDWINEEVVSTFEQNMEELDKKLIVEWYDAAHAFANPSNPDYDKEAAKAARTQAFDFLTKAYYLKE
ncbi:MAG: dienelactone hydrolase family protein [Chitinophagales bacterium]